MYQVNNESLGRVGGCHDQFGRWMHRGPCRQPPMMMPYRYPYASFRFGGETMEEPPFRFGGEMMKPQPFYEPFVRVGGVSKKTRQINMKRGCSLKTKKPIGASCVRVVNKALKVGRCKLTKNEQRVCRTLKAKRKAVSKPVIYNKPKKAIRSTSCGLTHAHIQRHLSHVNTEDFDDIEDLSDVSEYILETLAQERNCKLSASEKQFVIKTIQDWWYQEQLRNI